MTAALLRTIRQAALMLPALALSLAAFAQTPQQRFAPSAAPGSSNFVMGNPLARHNQTLYPFDLLTWNSGTITRLYFKYGSTSSVTGNTIDSLQISLVQLDSTLNLTENGSFSNWFVPDHRLTRVYTRGRTVVPAGAQDAWFALDLDTPFPFDSGRSLLVDIRFRNSTNQIFGVRTETIAGRNLRVYSDRPSDSLGSTSTSVPHLGADLAPVAGRPALDAGGLTISPNPSAGIVRLEAQATLAGKPYTLLDAAGRVVRRGRLSVRTEVRGLMPGLYVLSAGGVAYRVSVL